MGEGWGKISSSLSHFMFAMQATINGLFISNKFKGDYSDKISWCSTAFSFLNCRNPCKVCSTFIPQARVGYERLDSQ